MAIKDWRRIKEDYSTLTYVSNSNTFISAYKVRTGWAYRTPKSKGITTKSRARRIIKSYIKNHKA